MSGEALGTTLEISQVRFSVPLGDHELVMELDDTDLRAWDAGGKTCRSNVCGDTFCFEIDCTKRSGPPLFMHRSMVDLPHLSEVAIQLAVHYHANRRNPLGRFIRPTLRAMYRALDWKHGGRQWARL